VDPIKNPYAPGAGTPPPELAGRDELRETIRIALERVRAGRPAKSILMVGLRGVGKTVLLDRMREDAEASNIHTIRVEAPENRSLPAILAPQLRQALLRLSRINKAKELAQRALRGLAGFAKALKVKYQDIEVGIDFEPEPGLADNGDLEHDLQALLEVTGAAAKGAGTALAIFVDEMQYVEEEELIRRTPIRLSASRSSWAGGCSHRYCQASKRSRRDGVRGRIEANCPGDSWLSVFPSGMGKTFVGRRASISNHAARRRTCLTSGRCGSR